MKNHIAEELPARKHAPAAAGSGAAPAGGDKKDDSGKSPEQKAKQAVYDIRYRARREDIPLRQAYSQYMQNSSMGQQERTIVKTKLFGKEGGTMKAEDFNPVFKSAASDSLAKALFKVFVEGTESKQEPITLTYLEELDGAEHRKYKVRVTDKNTKKSYVRYATREKINQLRANPNIESVEMTGYGEPYEGEKKKGEQTARVASGKGLDPVGKEDSDINNDGKVNKTDGYLKKRRDAIGSAIATRKEEFIHEAETEDSNNKKIDVMKKGKKNKVVIAPAQDKSVGLMAHNELEGELIAEKAVSQAQQRFMGMVYAAKKGEKPASPEVAKAAEGMSEKEAKKFAKTKHEGLPEKVKEEMECGSDDKKKKGEKEEDSRSMNTKINLVRNKLRAMGLKMSYEPEGERLQEEPGDGYLGPAELKIKNPLASDKTRASSDQRRARQTAAAVQSGQRPTIVGSGSYANQFNAMRSQSQLNQSFEPEGEQIDEIAPVIAGAAALGAAALSAKAVSDRMSQVRNKVTSGAKVVPSSKPSFSDIMSTRNQQMGDLLKQNQSYEPEGEVVEERGEFRSLGRADKNDGRNRYMGSATPEQKREEEQAASEAAERAKAKLRANLAREAARKRR
jgi:hypothetical protein